MKKFLLSLMMVLAITACGDSSTDPTVSVSGRYNLKTVDGSNLPYTVVQIGSDKVELTAGFLQLESNGTFTVSLSSRTTQSGSTTSDTDVANGTWTQSGSAMTFSYPDGSVDNGTLSGSTITVPSSGLDLVFKK